MRLKQTKRMKENEFHKKAEDYLIDDIWLDSIEGSDQIGKTSNGEFNLAGDIIKSIADKKQTLTPTEANLLGNRIVRSISEYKRRTLVITVSAAAVLLLIIGISAVLTSQKKSDLSDFALHTQNTDRTGDTRLILAGKKEVRLKSTESKIAYVQNSTEIKVDTEIVNQSVNDNEMVYNTVVVPFGKRTQITLSDNSQVWLNSGSKLIYPARFASDKREVYLEGEAIFEVSHNKEYPFHVLTHDVEVKVLGTVFDLSAYPDEKITRTVLEQGSVEMRSNNSSLLGSSKATLVPGTMGTYINGSDGVAQTKVDTKLYTSWREGYISCEKQSLGDILKKISRYYNVTITLNDQSLANETFTGNLDLRNSAMQVLSFIAEVVNIKVENSNNQIIVTRI
jgi:Fe2+-dicitrate sensor, membrane component